MKPLRYGVIGCGRVFQRYHLPCVRGRSDYIIVAACDTDVEQARSVLADLAADALITADLDEFFSVGQPDVVAVCTPNDAHTAPVLAALAAGAAVLCEKPLAADPADARRIAEAAGASPLFGVNLPYRFHELIPAFAAALPDGAAEITLTFTTAGARLWRPVTKWYGDATRAGGGALLDLGSHALDLLVALFGWPRITDCRIDQPGVEERAVVDLMFARGPAKVRIDRASRTMNMLLEARVGGDVVTLDVRRAQVRSSAGVVTALGSRPELAAITGFLDAAAGLPGDVVGVADAVRLQELITASYATATRDQNLTI